MKSFIASCMCVLIFLVLPCCSDYDQKQEDLEEPISKLAPILYSDATDDVLKAIADETLFTFLGKTFDTETAIKLKDNGNYENKNSYYNAEYESRRVVINTLINEHFRDPSLYKHRSIDLISLIEHGCLIIIPRNPNTKYPIKNRIEYSAGDLFFAANEKGIINIEHLGISNLDYDAKLNDYNELYYYQPHGQKSNDELLTDGRSIFMFHKFTPDEASDFFKTSIPDMTVNPEQKPTYDEMRAKWFASQVCRLLTGYMDTHETIPDSLDTIINYYGIVNEKAWINPHTYQPMKLKAKFPMCPRIPIDVIEYLDRPKPLNGKLSQDFITKYEWNYSFVILRNEDNVRAIFCVYYLDATNQLISESCIVDSRWHHPISVNEPATDNVKS